MVLVVGRWETPPFHHQTTGLQTTWFLREADCSCAKFPASRLPLSLLGELWMVAKSHKTHHGSECLE